MSHTNQHEVEIEARVQKQDRGAFLLLGGSLIVSLLIVGALLIHVFTQSDTNTTQIKETQATALQLAEFVKLTCEKSTNPRLKGIREYLAEVKREAEHPSPAILKLLNLDKVPLARVRAASRDKIKRLNYDINIRFAPEDCNAVYQQELIDPTNSE